MLAQQMVNGVVSGATYALFALGFTLMFGVFRVINLTYGFYFSAGALMALYATRFGAVPIGYAIVIAGVGSGILALVLDALLLTPLRRARAPELASLMVTLGATLFLYSAMSAVFGTDIQRFPASFIGDRATEIGSIRITLTQAIIVAIAITLIVLLVLVLQRTVFGLAVRALAENPDAAQLMGVDAGAYRRYVSLASGALGGIAGVLIGLNYNAIQPYMGEAMMLKGFAVIVAGGLGNFGGAMIAGVVLGVLEALTAGYVASTLKDAVGFTLLVLTLWVRPTGLFGAEIRRS
jgi:branched-chain amino acid transport system permease protein